MVILDRSLDRLCNEVFQPFRLAYSSLLTIFSVKMIGLFVTAVVGVYTIEDLWEKFGDVKMPIVSLFLQNPYPEIGFILFNSVTMQNIGVLAYSVLSSCRSLSLWPLSKFIS